MGHDKSRDRDLGLDRPITRRDFLGGAGTAAAGAMVACAVPNRSAQTPVRYEPTGIAEVDYPPGAMGMRGSHSGSFEVAHEIAFNGRTNWGPVAEPDGASYDLVVVGGGVSG